MPKPSAPSVRERIMRYKNPKKCSNAVKTVTRAVVLYKFCMPYSIRTSHLFMSAGIAWHVKLLLKESEFYRVKRGQTLKDVAKAFSCPERLLASLNNLTEEVTEGEILLIPDTEGNLYTVRGGESKTLLSGSGEQFFEKNRTNCLYPTQKVLI